MKRISLLITACLLMVTLAACGTSSQPSEQPNPPASSAPVETPDSSGQEAQTPDPSSPAQSDPAETPDEDGGEILVAYFSATGNTEHVANHLEAILGADLYEIVPEIPYTDADLNYNDDDSRANQEQADSSARPAISGSVENMEDYDVIFLGYPIWWGDAPRIIGTFLESYELDGKTIVPFCTSASSGIGSSADNLHSLAEGANWLDGERFGSGASQDEVSAWVDGLELPA